jgi:hypothetical protein
VLLGATIDTTTALTLFSINYRVAGVGGSALHIDPAATTITNPGPVVVSLADGAFVNKAPTASFTSTGPFAISSSALFAGAKMTLDGSSSMPIFGTITSYAWAINGISVASGSSPTLTIASAPAAGSIVTLTVTTSLGLTGSASAAPNINTPPGISGKSFKHHLGFTVDQPWTAKVSNPSTATVYFYVVITAIPRIGTGNVVTIISMSGSGITLAPGGAGAFTQIQPKSTYQHDVKYDFTMVLFYTLDPNVAVGGTAANGDMYQTSPASKSGAFFSV